MVKFSQIFRKTKPKEAVIVVSGLPRSGTSMMMKMLEAAGLEALTDNIRTADMDNPKGYYEFERVKKLPEGDTGWLEEAQGKVVKIISELLKNLPPGHNYKVLFMRRSTEEILASQKQMLVRSGKPTDKVSDEKLAELYQKHLGKVESWLAQQPNFAVLYVDYNQLLADPRPQIDQIQRFLDKPVDVEKMAEIVDPNLYRQRKEK